MRSKECITSSKLSTNNFYNNARNFLINLTLCFSHFLCLFSPFLPPPSLSISLSLCLSAVKTISFYKTSKTLARARSLLSPIHPSSLRKLPSGHFEGSDLIWLVSKANEVTRYRRRTRGSFFPLFVATGGEYRIRVVGKVSLN